MLVRFWFPWIGSLDIVSSRDIILDMNSKNRKTLVEIFAEPVNGNLKWGKIEALLVSLGAGVNQCVVTERGL